MHIHQYKCKNQKIIYKGPKEIRYTLYYFEKFIDVKLLVVSRINLGFCIEFVIRNL